MPDDISEFLHEVHLFGCQGTLLKSNEILIELLEISRRRQNDVHVGIGQHEAVALTGVGDRFGFRVMFGTPEQIAPAGGGVADDAGMMSFSMRKNILFGSAVSRVVPNHADVNLAVSHQLTGELAIMTGKPDAAHLALFLEALQHLLHVRRELLRFQHAQKHENVDIVRLQLAQPLFQSFSQVGMPVNQIVGSGGDDDFLALAGRKVAQGFGHVGVEPVAEEVVYPFVQSSVNGLFAGAI